MKIGSKSKTLIQNTFSIYMCVAKKNYYENIVEKKCFLKLLLFTEIRFTDVSKIASESLDRKTSLKCLKQ